LHAAPLPYTLKASLLKATTNNKSFYITIKYEVTAGCLVTWLFFIWVAINVTGSYKIYEISIGNHAMLLVQLGINSTSDVWKFCQNN
jgi:hypothetical protein